MAREKTIVSRALKNPDQHIDLFRIIGSQPRNRNFGPMGKAGNKNGQGQKCQQFKKGFPFWEFEEE